LLTLTRLKSMKCNMAQGFYVNKPMLPDEFILLQQSWKEQNHSY